MKKLLLILIAIAFLSPAATTGVYSPGLTIQHGNSVLILRKGEKKTLSVRRGKNALFRPRGLTFFSDHPLTASVGLHSGIVRGNGCGEAIIFVADQKGNTARIKVKVVPGKGVPLWCFLLFLPVLLIGFYFIKRA